jgi:predicted pyridoxine 5'-phosphate oxidase superfamily flavin-nucleotide-binding protein
MAILTEDMKRVVERQRLGFVATVCADGTPNLSPKGTTMVWENDTLVFADIRSPETVRNLLSNPSVEINVVDPIVRKGYRFKGRARILVGGPTFDALTAAYRSRGVKNEFEHMVVVQVERALPIVSPAYDTGASEAEVRRAWEGRP